MIVIIRITGLIGMKQNAEETLNRLKLRKKYSCVVINEKPEIMGMLEKIRNFAAFGKIDEKMLAEIIKARGKKIGDAKAKISDADAQKIAKEIMAGKEMEKLGLKPWFSLHPARGGINTKKHYPRGVLGNHGDKINELIERML